MEPFHAAGRITDFVGATFAAVASLAAVRRAAQIGVGEHIDFSLMEVMTIAATTYADLTHSVMGRPSINMPPRFVEIPSIEPTADGWVGFNTNSRQQYLDFLVLIERPDLVDDAELATVAGRKARMDEWNKAVREFTTRHTTAEIVERATALRIPVAPVCSGRTVLDVGHLRERGVFVRNPGGDFEQPRPSYMVNGETLHPPGPAPALGMDNGSVAPRTARWRSPAQARLSGDAAVPLPLDGLRVLDCTAWWAGPSAASILGALGADVIHIESVQKPDGIRMTGHALARGAAHWWEYSAIYASANTNKRGLALDMSRAEGMELMHRLIRTADAVVENFSPRVFDQFGLSWEPFHRINPEAILVRMPAFGLSGPWRDNVGFAQTMEQVTGLAWITGHVDDQPRIHQGPCDPLAGMHAAFALLVALFERDHLGEGVHVETTMVEGALNGAAEQIIEWSAYGNEMQREGNRSPWAAPQGIYRCPGGPPAGPERWIAISCETDAHWQALRAALGEPAWANDPGLATHWDRRARHDSLDAQLRAWAATVEDLDAEVERLCAAGVPAGVVQDARVASSHPQHVARDFHETVDHPVLGRHPCVRPPFRFASVDQWIRASAPTLGQHNRELLTEIGCTAAELSDLEAAQIIGTMPAGL